VSLLFSCSTIKRALLTRLPRFLNDLPSPALSVASPSPSATAFRASLPPILDPSLSELLLAPSLLTLSLSSTSTSAHADSAELNMLSKTGGVALAPGELMEVVRLGAGRCAEWGAWLEKRVASEVESRGLEGAL
jgi:hypothetical protein